MGGRDGGGMGGVSGRHIQPFQVVVPEKSSFGVSAALV